MDALIVDAVRSPIGAQNVNAWSIPCGSSRRFSDGSAIMRPMGMADVATVLFPAPVIQGRVRELGGEPARDDLDQCPLGGRQPRGHLAHRGQPMLPLQLLFEPLEHGHILKLRDPADGAAVISPQIGQLDREPPGFAYDLAGD